MAMNWVGALKSNGIEDKNHEGPWDIAWLLLAFALPGS